MQWSNHVTLFEYSVFVIWKTINNNNKSVRKKRVIINIRDFNQITQIDVYFMSNQFDIIVAISNCNQISIVNALEYFYQWTIREQNKYKQTVIIHRNQKPFNVTIMSFKNSSIHVQKQINFMLKKFREFAKIYIDDIVFHFTFLKQHVEHLNKKFQKFSKYNVILNSKKKNLNFFLIVILNQIIDAFDMIIVEKKLIAIVKFDFSKILKQLKTYFELTKYLRNYIFFYAQIVESLQNRKMFLLRNNFNKNKSKKRFFMFKQLKIFTIEKYDFYEQLQIVFNKSSFLTYFNLN